MAPVLNIPTIRASTHGAFDGEVPSGVSGYPVGITSSSPLCRRGAFQDGNLMDWCWKGIPLTGVVCADQSPGQTDAEGLEVLPYAIITGRHKVLPQDKGVHRATVEKKPEDVPADKVV